MANSRVPILVGKDNGGNARLAHSMRTGLLPWAIVPKMAWSVLFDITKVGALDGDTSQQWDLHTLFPSNLFPANVERRKPYARLITNFTGGTVDACTFILGDTNDDNGLITSTSIFSGASAGSPVNIQTTGAAEYADRKEDAFVPLLTISTNAGNISALTAGKLLLVIEFSPRITV